MKKVLVGMSGGVDSAVSAILLKEKYEVIGVTMELIPNSDNGKEVKEICNKLNIKHININFSKEFNNCVINYFINEYESLKTPNPCIECNRKLKFGALYDYAVKNNIDFIATGHYARIEYSDKYKRYVLKKAVNKKKDQSYFLYVIKKSLLPFIIFPLDKFSSKDEIRQIAVDNDLEVANKSDSQDICFIKDGNYISFLENNGIKKNIGNIVYNNKIVGKHNGLYKYTIGQRKGLGISNSNPLYVIDFDKNNNDLIVGEESSLYKSEFYVKNYNLLLIDKLKNPIEVNVKTRYRGLEFKAVISMHCDSIKVLLSEPQKGITSGQSAVFYINDIVLGGGIII